ncbi:hypothetical protein IG631_23156 [Alternaria alternata]|nr:hypothetical protein IG631_23156 [Alternaria alternata]
MPFSGFPIRPSYALRHRSFSTRSSTPPTIRHGTLGCLARKSSHSPLPPRARKMERQAMTPYDCHVRRMLTLYTYLQAQDRMTIGCTMRFTVVMNADKPDAVTLTPLKVVDICTPSSPTSYLTPEQLEDPAFTADLSKVYRASWTGNGGMYAFGMKLERFHEVIVIGENECEVRTWEIMGGMLSRLVKVMYEDTLKGKVGLWCEDLKKYCEKVHNEAVTSG